MGDKNLSTREIFEDIMRNHYSRLFHFVKGIVKNDAVAQDITQETFISAYKSLGAYSEQGKIFAWLKTIARNIAYRHIQKENRYICLSLSGPASGYEGDRINLAGYSTDELEDALIAEEGYRHILEVVNRLPKHQRAVFYYRFVEGMSVNEVALRLNIPAGSVKSKSHFGLKKVKSELKIHLIEGGHIMNCHKTYEYLLQYAKDAILAEDKITVEKHLKVCSNCKDIAESLIQLVPHIKPAPEGIIRHYNISFPVDDGMILGYFGVTTHIHNYKKLNDVLVANNGRIPDGEMWFRSGFSSGIKHLAEFDNDGNRIEVGIEEDRGHMYIRYKKMKKVFEYHQQNTVSLSEDTNDRYKKSYDAPNLYIVKAENWLGNNARSGIYAAIPGKAKNIRMRQGTDVLECGAFHFAYDDRYITESQPVVIECTYNI